MDRELLYELTLEEPEAPELELEAEEPSRRSRTPPSGSWAPGTTTP